MSFALGVLVMASLSPLSMSNSVLGQKVEVIKGKKVNRTASKAAPELQPQTVTDNSQQNAKSAELDKKAAALDAREKQLAAKEAALDEKQQDQSAAEDQDIVNEQVANKDNRILDYHHFVKGGGAFRDGGARGTDEWWAQAGLTLRLFSK